MASTSEDSAITDVTNGFDQFDREAEKPLSTPLLKQLVHKSVRRWKSKHEALINKRIGKVKSERKKRLQDNMASTFPENRLIPLDILAKEWMEDNPITVDVRVYLIEKLFPSLIMGLEKLLGEVEKRQLVDSEIASPSFNPVNYLAQYLMRNNPIYSNFPEASPYARGLRKVAEDLKSNLFEMEANRLARLKAEAKERLEREKMAHTKQDEQKRRNDLLEDLFIKWVADEETIPLSVIQNALCSFCEHLKSLPDTVCEDEFSSLEIPEINTTGKLLTVNEFKEVMDGYTTSLSVEVFEQLMEHLTKCLDDYQQAAERFSIRYNLKMLFLACDHDAVGVLEHNRMLDVLENYYNSSTEKMRETLRNPREISSDDMVEARQDSVVSEEKREDEKRAKTDEISEENKLENFDEVLEKQQIDQNGAENEEELAKEDLQEDINKEAITDENEIREDSDGDHSPEQDQGVNKSEVNLSVSACGDNSEVLENENEASSKDSEDELSASTSEQSLFHETVITDENHLNRDQFVNLCEKFLGDEPCMKSTLDSLVRFIKVSFGETDQQRFERHEKARLEARAKKRKYMVEQLFDFWDVDRSGVLNFEEVVEVLSKWKDSTSTNQFLEFVEKSKETITELTCSELHDYIDSVCISCFPDESPFEAIVIFLHTSIERTFEERKRGEARKAWLNMIETTAKTSGGNLESVYKATFEALRNDGEAHGRNKDISASISFLEINVNPERPHRGANFLRYVAATTDDIPFVMGKCLYRDSKNVSFAVVDSGKPIHIPKVLNHPGVHLWNPERKEKAANGSLIMLPLKDHEKRVVGVLAVDTMADQQEKSVFITHEISFYQGVAKALAQAMQFVDVRSKTVKIADSAISWICRRSLSSRNCNFYLVEPGLHPSDGFVLRKMFTIDNQRKRESFENSPRMHRKDNLFRDYLFKCAESCDTITADAYGERHIAFPLRDARGDTIAVVDISIGDAKMLPADEMKEVKKMVQLLAEAHREIAGEIAGLGKMIVLEVEKQNENFRIEIMFDRLLLTDLRENVARLDARAFAEIKSYNDPPKLVHDILKTVLGIFHGEGEGKFENWTTCKSFINADLVKMVTQYDPTALSSLNVDEKKLSEILEGIPMGAVAKQASLPAQYLFNWAIVSLSLIEHTRKMNLVEVIQPVSAASTSDDGETIISQNTENV